MRCMLTNDALGAMEVTHTQIIIIIIIIRNFEF